MTTPTPADATQNRVRDYRYYLAVVGTALPAGLLAWLLMLHLNAVPAMRKIADVYGLTLSQRAQSVIRTSHWVGDNWWWVVPCLVPVAFANVVLIRSLARIGHRFGRAGRWVLPVVWIAAVSLALTVVAVRTWHATREPLDTMRDLLSR